MYTQVGQQVVRFAMRDDRTMFLFTFADKNITGVDTVEAQKAVLRERFGASGWECPEILLALDTCNDLYFDRVSQIQMEPQGGMWTRGRVTLVGDAASCVSLLAGQGSALAMVGAYILAGELHRAHGDYVAAFGRYQDLFGPFVLSKQKAAIRLPVLSRPSRTSRYSCEIRSSSLWLSPGLPILLSDAISPIRLPSLTTNRRVMTAELP